MNKSPSVKNILPSVTITDWFRAAAPYIHAHRHATFIIAFDGDTIALSNFDHILHDLAMLNSLGIRLVLVYGARPQIEQQCKMQAVTLNYYDALPIMTGASLDIAKSVIGRLRLDIEAKLSFNMPHTPMADARICCISGNVVTAKPIGIKDGVDFGYSGEVRRIDSNGIHQQLDLGNIVLLSPLGYSPTGETFYLSTEAIAAHAATTLKADKLIIIGDNHTHLARELTVDQALVALKKSYHHSLETAIHVCQSGVKRVHLLDRSIDGALLQELFSLDGAGTLISADVFEAIREATIDDVGGILDLIAPLEQTGALVKRSRDLLETEINHFTVMERDGTVIACAALYPCPDNKISELACLAVAKDYQNLGRGKQLLAALEKKTQSASICVLTTQTTHWFLEQGFIPAKITDLPVKKQALYNYQRNAKAFIKVLR